MKKLLCMVLALVMLFSIAACGNSSSNSSKETSGNESSSGAANGEPILVGVSCMETGSMAAGGLRMKQAITMAFEEINANGGVLGGRPLEMYLVDDTGTPTGAATAVNKILAQDVSVVIGPHTSPMVAAAMEYFKEAEVPFVSAATSPALLESENPYFFRISVSDAAVGEVMVKFAAEKFNAKKIGTIFITDDYGKAADNAARKYAESIGLQYYSEGMTAEDTDVTSQLLKIKEWGPDVIFSFTHDADSALVVRQLSELGIKDEIPYIGPNALPMPQVLDLIEASQAAGCYASTDFFPDTSDPVMKDFLDRFAERWDGAEAERYAAMYYSAAYLVADAIERAGSDDPEAIRNALAETKDFQCVLGKLNCSDKQELNSTIFILQIDENKNSSVVQKVTLD